MQKTAQKSQQKSVSGYPRIYALAEKGVNAAYVRVAFWAVGAGDFNASFRVTFQRAEISAKIAEIDAALAEGAGIFDAGDGKVYEISAELFGELRAFFLHITLCRAAATRMSSERAFQRQRNPKRPPARTAAVRRRLHRLPKPPVPSGVNLTKNEELRTKNGIGVLRRQSP